MGKKKRFADDGWAMWVTGDDTSTFYLNEWVDPRRKSFVDVGIRIRGVMDTKDLNVYVPFAVEREEVTDISFLLNDESVFRAIFSTRCIMDFRKNKCTSEMAYHGKTVDLVHISETDFTVKPLNKGTLITVSIKDILEYIDNDEAYFLFRLPHKNLDELFKLQIDVGNMFSRIRDLITSPVISEKYSMSVRVNEARLLPDVINQIGAFHRQKLNKAVVTISVNEDYQVNDANCYRIHRLERELYAQYAPTSFDCDDTITYEWNETREKNLYGHFNFFFGISRDAISKTSMLIYMILLLLLDVVGNAVAALVA